MHCGFRSRPVAPLRNRAFASPLRPFALAAIIVFIFLGTVLVARATNHWQTNVPRAIYQDLVPNADQATHPGY